MTYTSGCVEKAMVFWRWHQVNEGNNSTRLSIQIVVSYLTSKTPYLVKRHIPDGSVPAKSTIYIWAVSEADNNEHHAVISGYFKMSPKDICTRNIVLIDNSPGIDEIKQYGCVHGCKPSNGSGWLVYFKWFFSISVRWQLLFSRFLKAVSS